MTAHALRREADIARLRELALESGGRIELLETPSHAGRPIRLAIRCRTAASEAYPQARQEGVTLRIDLPSRYPFERPVLTVESRIFHPNVFASGVVCQGDKWLPGEGLDLLVKRIIRLVTFDPAHVNPASAANRAAAAWYLQQRLKTPEAFPTDSPPFASTRSDATRSDATRSGVTAAAGQGSGAETTLRVVRRCPSCGKGLRLPTGRSGVVACPACGHDFDART